MIWSIQSVQLSYRDRLPAIGTNQRVIVDKGLNRIVREFVLQNDQAGSFRTSEPGLHISVNLSRCRAVQGGIRRESPILGVLIPNDGCQPKDLFCDRGYADIRIAKRRSPKPWHTATGRIMDHLHCPSKLRDNILVGKRCHMGVRPGVHGNVILIRDECMKKCLRIVDDIDPNEEMRCLDVVRLKEGIQLF